MSASGVKQTSCSAIVMSAFEADIKACQKNRFALTFGWLSTGSIAT